MSYSNGESLLLTLVASVTGFSSTNTSRGKWGMLNKGLSARYAILKPGAFTRRFIGHTLVQETWSTIVEVWRRYEDDGTSMTNLEADVENVINKIDTSPRMGDTTGTITDSNAIGGGAVQEVMDKDGNGPYWVKQDITVQWQEETLVTFA